MVARPFLDFYKIFLWCSVWGYQQFNNEMLENSWHLMNAKNEIIFQNKKTNKIWELCIKKSGIDIPIHIGIAGPAKLQTLLKYSIECGVGASIKIIQKRAMDLTKLLLPYKPTTIITDLANYKANNPSFNIEKVHFFPLGGVKQVSDFVKEA